MSQNTPSNSPLFNIEKNKKNEENKIILLNKNDKNIIKDEEILKATPHFINENKSSNESVKEDYSIKRPITPNILNPKKVNTPLTCDNKCFANYKFNFYFERKENGVIVPKDKAKREEKKLKKIPNAFRIGNKNKHNKNKKLEKNKNLNNINNKQDYSNNKIYTRKDSQYDISNNSPRNTSLHALKYNNNQTSPIKPLKENKNIKNNLVKDRSHNNIKNNIKCSNIEKQKSIKTTRPKSVKNISPKKRNTIQINKLNDINKDKKNYNTNNPTKINTNIDTNINNKFNTNINTNEYRKKSNSVNKNTILPYLPDNKNKINNMKNQLETEFTNLFNILPDNYEDYPEITNNIDLIFQNIFGLKEYIHKTTQSSFRPKKNLNNNNKSNIK